MPKGSNWNPWYVPTQEISTNISFSCLILEGDKNWGKIIIYPPACKNQPLKPWMKHALQSTAQLVQKNKDVSTCLWITLLSGILCLMPRTCYKNGSIGSFSPQISKKVSHVCLCNYVLIFSHNGTGHNKIGKYPALGWSKRKMCKTFLMPGCLRKWMLEKVESFMIFSSCTKGMFCQAGPNLPEHEEHSPWNARHGKPNPTKPWEVCEGESQRCYSMFVPVCVCVSVHFHSWYCVGGLFAGHHVGM